MATAHGFVPSTGVAPPQGAISGPAFDVAMPMQPAASARRAGTAADPKWVECLTTTLPMPAALA